MISSRLIQLFDEAAKLVKEMAYAKFDETVETFCEVESLKRVRLFRDTTVLPEQFSAEIRRVLVFAKGDKVEEAKEAGAAYRR